MRRSTRSISARLALVARLIGVVAAMAGIVATGMFLRYPELGNGIVLAYGAIALLTRIPSLTTYTMAFILLVVVPFLSLEGRDDIMQYFTEYAFLLLCIGTVSYIVEQIPKNKR